MNSKSVEKVTKGEKNPHLDALGIAVEPGTLQNI